MRITIETDERGGAAVQPPALPSGTDALPAGGPSEALLQSVGAEPIGGAGGAGYQGAINAGSPSPELVAAIEAAEAASAPVSAASTAGADGGPAPVE